LFLLRGETAAAGLASHQAEPADRPKRLLVYAGLAHEVARRTGEAEMLAKAASAAERSARLAGSPAAAAAARLVQASSALTAGALFADPGGLDAAQAWIATPEVAATPALGPQAMALRARIEARRALADADLDHAVQAGGVLDAAVDRLDVLVRETGEGRAEAAALRAERAEFLIGIGLRLKDRGLIVQAEADLRQLSDRLDPARLPLSWARAEALRGSAQAALGDLDGEAAGLAASVRTLAAAAEQADFDYSPLDRGRISHAMGLGLQALAEACGDEGLYDHTLAAFDQTLVAMAQTPALPLRALVIHDRAACVARRAEKAGDLVGLARAEAEFKSELARRGASADPIAWAVAQLALARVYEARAELKGEAGPPPETGFALAEAFEVFTEEGLKALAELAQDGLARLRDGSRANS